MLSSSASALAVGVRRVEWTNESGEKETLSTLDVPQGVEQRRWKGRISVLCYVSVHGIGRTMQVTKHQTNTQEQHPSLALALALALAVNEGKKDTKRERDGASSLALPFPCPPFFSPLFCGTVEDTLTQGQGERGRWTEWYPCSSASFLSIPSTSQMMHAYVHGMRRIALAPHPSPARKRENHFAVNTR